MITHTCEKATYFTISHIKDVKLSGSHLRFRREPCLLLSNSIFYWQSEAVDAWMMLKEMFSSSIKPISLH